MGSERRCSPGWHRTPSLIRGALVAGLYLVMGIWVLHAVPATAQEASREGGAGTAAPATRSAGADYGVVYRPPSATYRSRKAGRFLIIYPAGREADARQMAHELQAHDAYTDSLVGNTPHDLDIPVVLNDFNDRSNGFVQTFPFKSEIELPVLRRHPLSIGFQSWPEAVGPHELTHAYHADSKGGWFGVGGLIRLFAPDVARSINLAAPAGWIEGIAVYRESQIRDDAGRLNEPTATMKWRAAMESGDPWSLTQVLEAPRYTRPLQRHYLGGGLFLQYLAGGDDVSTVEAFHETTAFFNQFPFLGFGIALQVGTGDYASTLRDSLRAQVQPKPFASDLAPPHVVSSDAGRIHRRPYWIDERSVVAYVQAYDWPSGFYRFNVDTGESRRIRTQAVTEGYEYALNADTTALLTGRYVPDAFATRQARAEVETISLDGGHLDRLTHHARVFAPVRSGSSLLALQNDGAASHVVEVDPSANGPNAATPLTRYANTRVVQLLARPNASDVAALVNVDGDQRLYRLTGDGPDRALKPWIGFSQGNVYDASFGPKGRYVLFAAAAPDTVQAYAYDVQDGTLHRLTHERYGAFEPSLSPNGTRVAYVRYQNEQYDLVTRPFEPGSAIRKSDVGLEVGSEASSAPALRTEPREVEVDWSPARDYKARRHLAPRMVYPYLNAGGDDVAPDPTWKDLGYGVGIQGVDPLQTWAYGAEGWVQEGRLWGQAQVRNASLALRPSLSVFYRPDYIGPLSVRSNDQVLVAQGRVDERGVGLGLSTPITLASNVRQSVLLLGADTEYRQQRAILDEFGSSGFSDRVTLRPSAVLAVRLQSNVRDVIPNSGLLLQTTARNDVWTDGTGFARQAGAVSDGSVFLPLLRRWNTGIRLGAGLVYQRTGSEYNVDRFLPPGNEGRFVSSGTIARFRTEVVQPIFYVDDGLTSVPIYVQSIYGFGVASTAREIDDSPLQSDTLTSLGGGLGIQFRIFSILNLDLRFGAAYRVQEGDVVSFVR